jgi:hypothetical protein
LFISIIQIVYILLIILIIGLKNKKLMEYFKEFINELCKFVGMGLFIGIVLKQSQNFQTFNIKDQKKHLRLFLKNNTVKTREQIIELGVNSITCPLCKSAYYN